jgi:hypothetical protein
MEVAMQAQKVWEISGLGGLGVELQLLREGKRKRWRAVGEEAGRKWSVDLPSPPGTVIWLPALPGPDALQRISWWGMEELGVEWGEAVQLRGSLWLCPLLVQRGVERVERVILGSLSWGPGIPQLLALVSAPLVSVSVQNRPRFALAAFLKLGWSEDEGARVFVVFPRDAEGRVWKLLERSDIREPVLVAWARVEKVAASSSALADLGI